MRYCEKCRKPLRQYNIALCSDCLREQSLISKGMSKEQYKKLSKIEIKCPDCGRMLKLVEYGGAHFAHRDNNFRAKKCYMKIYLNELYKYNVKL